MKLDSIHLQNYRAHQDLSVEFSKQFTVVAGINGSGKTSLLKGICDAFAGLFFGKNIPFQLFPEGPRCAYEKSQEAGGQYRFEPQYPIQVSVRAQVVGQERSWQCVGNPNAAVDGAISIMVSNNNIPLEDPLPLVVFYRAASNWFPAGTLFALPAAPTINAMQVVQTAPINAVQAVQVKNSRADGYKNWWDAGTHSNDLLNWIVEKTIERLEKSSKSGQKFNEIKDDALALANDALSLALGGDLANLRYDVHAKSWLLDGRSASEIKTFEHLSDGERKIICLIVDIVRRICLLNPQLGKDALAQTSGLVLIDELDAHLHPKWQRVLASGLKKAFPQMQFIATSHSPQVLGELQPGEIVLLGQGEAEYPHVSYGMTSDHVLKVLMGAPTRNANVEEKLQTLWRAIEEIRLDDAESLLGELRNIAPDIPELNRAEALILRKKAIGK